MKGFVGETREHGQLAGWLLVGEGKWAFSNACTARLMKGSSGAWAPVDALAAVASLLAYLSEVAPLRSVRSRFDQAAYASD
jgi:hypothetical protein